MARIRTIKPEFWTDEKLSECSLSARLLFVGLISHADDEGRMDNSPTRIRLQIFPCGKVTHKQLTEWLRELTEHSLIRFYTLENKHYLDIPGFTKHQKINRPTPSRLPPYSMSTQGVLTEPSPLEGNGKERKGSSAAFDPSSVAGLDIKAWEEWVSFRKKRKPPIGPESMQKAAEQMAALGPRQRAAVDYSIANSYQGLIEPKASALTKTAAPNHDAAWAEARTRAKAIGFRDPYPHETPGAYMTDIKMAESAPRSGPKSIAALTEKLRMPA